MSDINVKVGNVVRIGGGKVEFEVVSVTDGFAALKGEKSSRKAVDINTLVVVSHASREAIEAVLNIEDPAPLEIVRTAPVEVLTHDVAVSATTDTLTLIVDGVAVRSKGSFETLAFHMSRLKGTYTVASIARDGKALVTRYAA